MTEWIVYIYYVAIVLAIVLVGLSGIGALGLDLDHDGHPDMEGDHDNGGILSLLGIGKAPLSILLMSYLLSFGAAGILFCAVGSYLPNYEFYSLVFSSGFSVVSTAVFARIVARFIPSVETYAKGKEDLLSREGVVITRVSPMVGGSVDVRDAGGSLHRIPAITISGAIMANEKVLVVLYDDEKSTYEVERLPN